MDALTREIKELLRELALLQATTPRETDKKEAKV